MPVSLRQSKIESGLKIKKPFHVLFIFLNFAFYDNPFQPVSQAHAERAPQSRCLLLIELNVSGHLLAANVTHLLCLPSGKGRLSVVTRTFVRPRFKWPPFLSTFVFLNGERDHVVAG